MSASTVILNGLTTHDYGTYYPYFAIRNDSGGVVYASTTDPECTPGSGSADKSLRDERRGRQRGNKL